MLLDSSAIKPGIWNGLEFFLHRRTRNTHLNTSEQKNLIRHADFLAYRNDQIIFFVVKPVSRLSHNYVHFFENRAKLGKLHLYG